MGVPIQTPMQRQLMQTQGKMDNSGAKTGQLVGTAIGTTIGALAGGPMGAMAGAGGGGGLGATVGGLFDEANSKPGQVVEAARPTMQVPVGGGSAMNRRMASIEPDPLHTVGQGIQALASQERSTPGVTQEYGPQLFQSYQKLYNDRSNGGRVA